jgi:hypothetical protein
MKISSKRCECGYVVVATTAVEARKSLQDHCDYRKCNPENSKDV